MADTVVLAGGSGFLGRSLAGHLSKCGYRVVVLSRSAGGSGIQTVSWDGKTLGGWCDELEDAAAVINLTGKSANCRYTPDNRREILESRLDSVRVLESAVAECRHPPRVFIQAASLAIYGDAGVRVCTEDAPKASGFSPDVCVQWERAVDGVAFKAIRTVIFRIGFTLGRDGGALATLSKLARWFLGGAVGDGRQFISWIHIGDLNAMFQRAIEYPSMTGIYNATGPAPVANGEFMKELRAAVGRPWAPPTPAFAVKIGAFLMGTDASLALTGRRCTPQRLLREGFLFQFPELRMALADALNNHRLKAVGLDGD